MTDRLQRAPAPSQPWLLALALSLPVLLLPFGRAFQAPLAVLAVLGLVMLLGMFRERSTFNAEDKALQVLPRAVLFLWLPVLIACIDADAPAGALQILTLYPAYGLMALAVVVLLRARAAFRAVAVLVSIAAVLWAFDGLAQLWTGIDMVDIPPARPGIASSFFMPPSHYGFVLALFACTPLYTLYLLGANRLSHILAGVLMTAAVLCGGERSDWLMYAWSVLPYVFLAWIMPARRPLAALITVPLFATALVAAIVAGSTNAQTQLALGQTINAAGSWSAAAALFAEHPVNGVGVGGFGPALAVVQPVGAYAHQVLLEIGSETGLIGLALYLLLWASMWRLWRNADDRQRCLALPLLMPLFALWWPLNSHPQFYSPQLAGLSFFLLAYAIAALTWRGESA